MANNFIRPYPNYDFPYVGSYYPSYVQDKYGNKQDSYRPGVLVRNITLSCVDSMLVKSSFGGGLPAGVFVKLNPDNHTVNYLNENDTIKDIFGVTLLNYDYVSSEEGIPGIQNERCISIVRPLTCFSGSFLASDNLDIYSNFGLVVKSNSPEYPLGSLANYIESTKDDDIYMIDLTNSKIRLLDIDYDEEYTTSVYLEYTNSDKFSVVPPVEEDYPIVGGSPTFDYRAHLVGGVYFDEEAKQYLNNVITVDRETGHASTSLLGPYSQITPPVNVITKPTSVYMLNEVKVLFGGSLGYLSTNTIIDVDGVSTYWNITQLQIPDAETTYGMQGAYTIANGGTILTQRDPLQQDPGLMQLCLIYVGGTILSSDYQQSKKLLTMYKADVTQGLFWSVSTELKIGDYFIDASRIFLVQPEKYVPTAYAIGCGKYLEEDPNNLIFNSILKISMPDIDAAPIIEETVFEDPEVLNILKHMRDGAGDVVQQNEWNYIYFMTSGTYPDTQGKLRNFAMLKLDPGNMSVEVILGDQISLLLHNREFVMRAPVCVKGIGEAGNVLRFYGTTNISGTMARNVFIAFDTSTHTWLIRRINDEITIPIYSSTSSNPMDSTGLLNYYPISGSPNFQNTDLILGGLINGGN